MGRRGKTTPELERAWADAAAIVARRRAGDTLETIAADYGIGKSTAKEIAAASGYVSPAARAKSDRERIKRLCAAGASPVKVAASYGCSEDTIRRIVGPSVGRYNHGSVEDAERRIASGLTLAEKRAIPTERFAEALQEAGGDVRAAALAIGVTPEAVRRRLNLRKPLAKSQLSGRQLREAYEAGWSLSQLAVVAGVCKMSVSARLEAMGVELRPVGGANYRPAARVIRTHLHAACLLYQQGATADTIAREFECARSTAQRLLRLEGVAAYQGRRGADQERMAEMCRAVRRGELVVEAGRLVPRLLEHSHKTTTGENG